MRSGGGSIIAEALRSKRATNVVLPQPVGPATMHVKGCCQRGSMPTETGKHWRSRNGLIRDSMHSIRKRRARRQTGRTSEREDIQQSTDVHENGLIRNSTQTCNIRAPRLRAHACDTRSWHQLLINSKQEWRSRNVTHHYLHVQRGRAESVR